MSATTGASGDYSQAFKAGNSMVEKFGTHYGTMVDLQLDSDEKTTKAQDDTNSGAAQTSQGSVATMTNMLFK